MRSYTQNENLLCQIRRIDYSYVIRNKDFIYVNDSVYFSTVDSQWESSSPIMILDSNGNHLFEVVEGNGTYEIRDDSNDRPVLVKISDDLPEIDCGMNSCEKYTQLYDVTVRSSREDRLGVIADIYSYSCLSTETKGVGTCFPYPLADINAEVFLLNQGEYRNFKHKADQIIITFEDIVIDIDRRKNPNIGSNIDVNITPDGVKVDYYK